MAVRVVILQSNYVPWRGYFDLIDDADYLVIYDEVQYTKNDWRNRNRIKTSAGTRWLTVPVRHIHLHQTIAEVETDDTRDWRADHTNRIREAYGQAAYFAAHSEEFFALLHAAGSSLSALNRAALHWLMDKFDIATQVVDSRDFPGPGRRTERLIGILKALRADVYLSGPSAAAYLDHEAFRREGIGLEYKRYEYEPYAQLWGAFDGAVSALDVVFNTGPDAPLHLKSGAANVVAA